MISLEQHPFWETLSALWSKGTSFLGCRYAILGGAMTWVSDHRLVASISSSGGFGVLAGGALFPEALDEEIRKTQELTLMPFGVNLIVFHHQIQDLVNVCIERQVGHVFLGGGFPSPNVIEALKAKNIRMIGFAPSVAVGKRLIKAGIDALVLEGSEAGGHVGPVSTYVLAQEILPALEVPLFVAGGIGSGRGMLSYLWMGASGCQLGTRFVCATESRAHPKFKEAFIKANARDATLSVQLDPRFPVIPVRALENRGKQNFLNMQREVLDAYNQGMLSQKEAQMKLELFWAGALRRAVLEGDIEEGSLMAGQSVGMVKSIEPCEVIIHGMIEEMLQGLEAQSQMGPKR
jgi:enoyl-[acyl-carrier protein] reductase II